MLLSSHSRGKTSCMELEDILAKVRTMNNRQEQNADIVLDDIAPPSSFTIKDQLDLAQRWWKLRVSVVVPQDTDVRDHLGR